MKKRKIRLQTVLGWLLAALMVGLIVFLWLSASASPVDATYAFLKAVRTKNVAKLVAITELPEGSPPADKQWRELFNKELKSAGFVYNPRPEEVALDPDGKHAMVRVTCRSGPHMTQESDIQVPLVLINGKWKVETSRMDNTVIPALPK